MITTAKNNPLSKIFLYFIFILFIYAQAHAQKADTLRLYYALNESELSTVNKNKIDSLLSTGNAKDSVSIFGYADDLGGNKYNYNLSEKRAIFVKNYFIAKGFKQSIKYCIGKGEIKNNGNETPADRKVEIIVFSKPLPPAKTPIKFIPKTPPQDTTPIFNSDSLLAGKNVILKGLYFKKGTDILLNESFPELDALVKTLKENPGMIIEIQGHICCELITYPGFDKQKSGMGEELSTKRAKQVYDYLVKKGISKKRLTYQGYGGTRPIVRIEKDNTDADKNRRVEIKVLQN